MLPGVRTAITLIFRIAKGVPVENKGIIGPNEPGIMMIVSGWLTLPLAALVRRAAMRALKALYAVTKGYPEIPRLCAGLQNPWPTGSI